MRAHLRNILVPAVFSFAILASATSAPAGAAVGAETRTTPVVAPPGAPQPGASQPRQHPAGRQRVEFVAPVDAPVTDPFRPPANPYGPGNRGIEYRTTTGSTVRTAAAGTVVFAGQVGGRLDVVVLHADAIRTTYAGLASIAVVTGAQLVAGQAVGTAGESLHFGVRAGRAYVDPAVLLAPPPRRARLLPVLDEPSSGAPARRAPTRRLPAAGARQ